MKRLLPLLLVSAAPLAEPPALAPALPAPQDVAYPGKITLDVDATDTDRRIFRVHETLPLTPTHDDVVLLYPKWIPGNHGPTGPIEALAGLVVKADGARLPWVRDPVAMYAFHVHPSAAARALDISFQFVSPPTPDEGRVVMTPDMLNLQWDKTLLYPAGFFARRIPVAASITVPQRWQVATALETDRSGENTTHFKPVPLDVLIDSPIFAGRYFSRLDLQGTPPVHLDIVADKPDLLAVTDAELGVHRALVAQASALFGAHHYAHYDFLLALSDRMSGIGLEHHQSSEDGAGPTYFTEWDKTVAGRDLLSHEYTHSWNGKFRRPADLWQPDYERPEGDSLLWVYEGQTQYWGQVLAARSGLFNHQQALDSLALIAAGQQAAVGRAWRPLQDTTNDPIFLERRPQAWHSWQREEDYYNEGLLTWLDADTLIRERTNGAKSLDDFAHAFFGIEDGRTDEVTYTFDDVVSALNAVCAYDWTAFLRAHLDDDHAAPLDGITRGGYRLVFSDTPSDFQKSAETRRHISDFTFSLGLAVKADGTLTAVQWDGPAFRAGLTQGLKITAINNVSWQDADQLKDAVRAAKSSGAALSLTVEDKKFLRTVTIDYRGGLRYPHLERVAGTKALLDDVIAPKKG